MHNVSILRLHVLRAYYLLIAVGLGITIWPGLIAPPDNLSHMGSVVRSVLGAVSLLALLGLRYPLKMLPVLFFELAWKTIWVLKFGLPLWLSDALDASTADTMFSCLMGIVLTLVTVPWGYAAKQYLTAPADPWKGTRAADANGLPSGP